MLWHAPGVYVAHFRAGLHRQPVGQQPPEHARDPGYDGLASDGSHYLACFHRIANAPLAREGALAGGAEHSLNGEACRRAGYAGVRLGSPCQDNPPQMVPPRLVSITAWTSAPAVKPGPKPTTMGASVMLVPVLRLTMMASTTTGGRSRGITSPRGSMTTGT
jgi:hypothetical protein